MFDDFRNQTDESAFEEKPEEEEGAEETLYNAVSSRRAPRQDILFGMTAPQRLVIAVMLFMMTCISGTLILLVFEKIIPPFLG